MGLIDVSELMTDPDFVTPIAHITRQTVVNNYGENVLTESSSPTVGSVQPMSGHDIDRLPEAVRTSNVMTFWMRGRITASAPGRYSDILVFRGQRFQVIHVDDWSIWGAGYSAGACVAERPS